jgi:hypothetical protein
MTDCFFDSFVLDLWRLRARRGIIGLLGSKVLEIAKATRFAQQVQHLDMTRLAFQISHLLPECLGKM